MRRRAAFLVLLVLMLSCPHGARAGPDEDIRPWQGILPDPDQARTADAEWFVTRVLDARTLEPIPGARWIRTPEWLAPWRLHHDVVLDTAMADALGIAHMSTRPEAWTDECHWLVTAPGYAPAHEYGVRPEPEALLEPGVIVRGRVLDPLGRLVPGAVVEYLGGCSHGTAAARCLTAPDGTFGLGPVPSSLPGQLWIAGPGIAADLMALDTPVSLGSPGVQIVMEPGLRYEGRLVDLLGAPVRGAVVRAWNEQRGPTAMSDADGRFVIEGVESDASLLVYAPGDLLDGDSRRHVDDASHNVPMLVVVSPVGVDSPEEDARIRVRARDANGDAVHGVSFHLLDRETNRGPTGWTADAGADDTVEDVVAGDYLLVPDEPFSGHVFLPTEVAAAAGEEATVELLVHARPRLAIRGALPDEVELVLAVPSAAVSDRLQGSAWSPALPSGVAAVLRVEIEGRPPFFFPVGPDEHGMRTVSVTLPEPRLIRLPSGATEARLLDGERDAFGYRQGDFLATDASGRLTLRWETADGRTREAQVEVPEEAGARIRVDPSQSRDVVHAVRVGVLAPGEEKPESAEWQTVAPGEVVEFEREGWRRLRAAAPAAGETVLRWGPCALRLHVRDEDGRVDALALIDGEVYAMPDGSLDLRGFDPGPLYVVVARRDRAGAGARVRLALKDGIVSEREVVLGAD